MDELDLFFEQEEEDRVMAAVGLVSKTDGLEFTAIQSVDWLAECDHINEAVAMGRA